MIWRKKEVLNFVRSLDHSDPQADLLRLKAILKNTEAVLKTLQTEGGTLLFKTPEEYFHALKQCHLIVEELPEVIQTLEEQLCQGKKASKREKS